MRRRLLLAAVLLLAVVLPAAPASAITNGTADGGAHPNVGGLVSETQYSDGTWIYCSGTLVSPTVFLTAAVVLDKAVKGITPATLPRADSLSALSSTQQFTSVGYGAYEVTNSPGGHQYLYDDVRMVATGTLNATNKTWLRISMNPSTGNGGTCYGDSGGPNFLGTSQVVAAITITGDAICRSTNVDYRLD